eukprot:scaffold288885_cov46-Prasinocladus_malaysianus.AAC.1
MSYKGKHIRNVLISYQVGAGILLLPVGAGIHTPVALVGRMQPAGQLAPEPGPGQAAGRMPAGHRPSAELLLASQAGLLWPAVQGSEALPAPAGHMDAGSCPAGQKQLVDLGAWGLV